MSARLPLMDGEGQDEVAQAPAIARLFESNYREWATKVDRLLAWILSIQWVSATLFAYWVSPTIWAGRVSVIHSHVYAAALLGGLITLPPVLLAWRRPGHLSTRYVVACAQMLWSALLIHLTGGRIETHFHVFGSLAILAFYRDIKVLLPATVIVAVDHFVRGLYWPESVYGIANPAWWRFLEHAGWVIFIDVFLCINCINAYQELWELSRKQVLLELSSDESRRRQTYLEGILRSITDTVVVVNEKSRIDYANEAARLLLGYDASRLMGMELNSILSTPMDYAALADWKVGQIDLRTKEGESIPAVMTISDLEADRSRVIVIRDQRDVLRRLRAEFEARQARLQTEELKQAYGQLEQAHKDLATAQEQLKMQMADRERMETELRLAQKLESVGMLASGIAHEINTPTQFVGDNLRFLEDSFKELVPMLEAIEQNAAGGTGTSNRAGGAHREVDLKFLIVEIPSAIGQSLEGVERVAQIVRAMKDFSHPDSTQKEATDLNSSIETTATVCKNEWKYVADLDLDLDPQLPSVTCQPGEINQVILNLLVNGAHAIEEVNRGSTAKGKLTVSSRQIGNLAEIRIGDTGGGIPEAVREKIFTPFFTTKEVGKGTGQGLAIAHRVVVENHGGRIWFESEVGRGTTFVIQLPIGRELESIGECPG